MENFLLFLLLHKKGRQYYTVPLFKGALLVAFGWLLGQYTGIFMWTYHDLVGYDKILHTLGGAWWALLGIAVYDFRRGVADRAQLDLFPEKITSCKWTIMLTGIAWALTVGIAWEVLEYIWPLLRSFFVWNPLDTAMDVVWDLVGSLIVGWRYTNRLLMYHTTPRRQKHP